MSKTITLDDGSIVPVVPFRLMAGINANGDAAPLKLDGDSLKVVVMGGTPEGGATAANQTAQIDYAKRSYGENGWVRVTDDTPQADGDWCAIVALADTVIASITGTGITGDTSAIPLLAGMAIYGPITDFTLTSGDVIAYNA